MLSETTDSVTTAYDYGVERISAYEKIGWSTLKTDYVYDGRGSVAQELHYNSSWYTFGGFLSNKGLNSYTYTPFGDLLTGEGSGFRFDGEYYDSATGMLNLRARQYETAMMRFAQRDLLKGDQAASLSLNRYLYCENDSVNFVDPSGKSLASLWNKAKTTVSNATTAIKKTATAAVSTVKNTVKSVGSWVNQNKKTIAKVAVGVLTIAACVGITVLTAGLAAPAAGAIATAVLAASSGVAMGITFSYGNNLMHQIDQTSSFKDASDNAAKATTQALPYIIGGAAVGGAVAGYISTLTGGALPSLGLKATPFAASAFDDTLEDTSGAYSGAQAEGATQSGSAGTTACTGEQVGEGASSLGSGGVDFGKLGKLVENPNIKVDWGQYANHGLERMLERNISTDMVNNWVSTGKVLQQSNGQYLFITENGAAVVSATGKLITAMSKFDFDETMLDVVNDLLH